MSKDAPAFLHDANARRDPKMIRLKLELGHEGVGIWWELIEILRESDLRIAKSDLDVIAYDLQLQTSKLEMVIATCLKVGLLHDDDTYIWSESLVRRIEAYEERSRSHSERAREKAAKRWGKTLQQPLQGVGATPMPQQCSSISPVERQQCSGCAEGVLSDALRVTQPNSIESNLTKPARARGAILKPEELDELKREFPPDAVTETAPIIEQNWRSRGLLPERPIETAREWLMRDRQKREGFWSPKRQAAGVAPPREPPSPVPKPSSPEALAWRAVREAVRASGEDPVAAEKFLRERGQEAAWAAAKAMGWGWVCNTPTEQQLRQRQKEFFTQYACPAPGQTQQPQGGT